MRPSPIARPAPHSWHDRAPPAWRPAAPGAASAAAHLSNCSSARRKGARPRARVSTHINIAAAALHAEDLRRARGVGGGQEGHPAHATSARREEVRWCVGRGRSAEAGQRAFSGAPRARAARNGSPTRVPLGPPARALPPGATPAATPAPARRAPGRRQRRGRPRGRAAPTHSVVVRVSRRHRQRPRRPARPHAKWHTRGEKRRSRARA